MQTAIISVINDLNTDVRVHKNCMVLKELGYNVILFGREKKISVAMEERPYKTIRKKMFFEKKIWFYAEYNIRLFFFLLFKKPSILVSNDLDTLFPNFIISKIKKVPLIYDSHEYFTEMPEVINRKIVKKTWEKLEKFIFPNLKNEIITVNESIANLYEKKYNKKLFVVRNIPELNKTIRIKSREELNLPIDKKIIILQGAGININRGAEEAIEAMKYVENAILLIIGGGEVFEDLFLLPKKFNIENKVVFIKKLPYKELIQYTFNSNLGLTLDKDTNINYKYSLPNKLFDYINAQIPILSSNLIELRNIISKYNIGTFIESHSPIEIAEKINKIIFDEKIYNEYKENLKIAVNELTWEKEKHVLINIYKNYLNNE